MSAITDGFVCEALELQFRDDQAGGWELMNVGLSSPCTFPGVRIQGKAGQHKALLAVAGLPHRAWGVGALEAAGLPSLTQ